MNVCFVNDYSVLYRSVELHGFGQMGVGVLYDFEEVNVVVLRVEDYHVLQILDSDVFYLQFFSACFFPELSDSEPVLNHYVGVLGVKFPEQIEEILLSLDYQGLVPVPQRNDVIVWQNSVSLTGFQQLLLALWDFEVFPVHDAKRLRAFFVDKSKFKFVKESLDVGEEKGVQFDVYEPPHEVVLEVLAGVNLNHLVGYQSY